MASVPEKLLLAAPRGYCAGVDRAVQTVERALERYGAPVYVRKEIVHNKHVVEQLRERGAVFVESETEVPGGRDGRVLGPRRRAERARERPARASCTRSTRPARSSPRSTSRRRSSPPRATRSCSSATPATRRSRARWGRRPEHIVLIENEEDVDALEVEDPSKVAYISQTTLSVDETRGDHRPPARALPGDRRAPHRRHLLRDDQPPGGGQAARARVRPRARDRLAQLVELQPARRGRARARRRLAT